ncbi:glutamate decarboxylase, partial [human gut metagenome]
RCRPTSSRRSSCASSCGQGMSRDMADMLLQDIRNAVAEFEELQYPTPSRLKFERSEHQKGKVYTH